MLIRNKKILVLSAVGVMLIVLGVWVGLHVYRFEVCNLRTPSGDAELMFIDSEISANELLQRLDANYDIASIGMMKTHARLMGIKTVRPGCFMIPHMVSDHELLTALRANWQHPINVTLGTARTLPALAQKLAPQLLADSAAIANALTDSTLQAHYGFTPQTAIAMYLPDTYQMLWTTKPEQLVERMAQEYQHYWTRRRLEKAKAQGLTPIEVITLASIVNSETNNAGEMPTVAGLYLNRLRRGMRLQSDPTVIFAAQDFSIRRVKNEHLKIDSPYNTYIYAGLPPGPIRIPQKAAIEAVLNPQESNYIYMCAKETFDGTHNFATNLSEHTANARRYHQALNQRKIK